MTARTRFLRKMEKWTMEAWILRLLRGQNSLPYRFSSYRLRMSLFNSPWMASNYP